MAKGSTDIRRRRENDQTGAGMEQFGIRLRDSRVVFGRNGGQAEEKVALFYFKRLTLSIILFFVGFFCIVFSFIAGIYLHPGLSAQAFVHIFCDDTRQRENGKNMK